MSPGIASVAALIGDPTRSLLLFALMDGRSLTVSELAGATAVTVQTASSHLSKLELAGLLSAERQGRHRYYRLSGPDVAAVIEGLMGLAERTRASRMNRVMVGPLDSALRHARICYDHLAGERGVQLYDALQQVGHIEGGLTHPGLSPSGEIFFQNLGIDTTKLASGRRPLCRACLDWSERRHHLAGAVGAALLLRLVDFGWVRRTPDRCLQFTAAGLAGFDNLLQTVRCPTPVSLPDLAPGP